MQLPADVGHFERAIHDYFALWRLHGEWFDVPATEEIAAEVAGLCADVRRPNEQFLQWLCIRQLDIKDGYLSGMEQWRVVDQRALVKLGFAGIGGSRPP